MHPSTELIKLKRQELNLKKEKLKEKKEQQKSASGVKGVDSYSTDTSNRIVDTLLKL